MRVVAAIPAFNEEVTIGSVIARTKPDVDEVVVIDDGSHDSTSSVARSMGVTVLCHEVNSGKGVALRTAFAWPSNMMWIFLSLLTETASIILMRSQVLWRPFLRVTNLNSVVKVNDSQSGFRAFHSSSFDAFRITNSGMGIESEMIAEAAGAGLRIIEVPLTCRYDVDGATLNPVKHGLGVLNSIVWDILQIKAHSKDVDDRSSLN